MSSLWGACEERGWEMEIARYISLSVLLERVFNAIGVSRRSGTRKTAPAACPLLPSGSVLRVEDSCGLKYPSMPSALARLSTEARPLCRRVPSLALLRLMSARSSLPLE